MSKDLRTFLTETELEEPIEVLRVKREVDPRFEVTGVLAQLEKQRKFPIVIFEKVRGSALPVVTNVHADARRLFRAVGLKNGTLPEFIREYAAREDSPQPPVMIKEAPVHEVVLSGKDLDVTRLPILTYHEKDAGRYITAGFGIMRDPDSRVRNAGIYRLMVHSPDTFGVQLSETAHGQKRALCPGTCPGTVQWLAGDPAVFLPADYPPVCPLRGSSRAYPAWFPSVVAT